MATVVKLPQFGRTMQEGTIVDFMVAVGDQVKSGRPIFEVETDKACMEVESPADGFVKYIIAELGRTLTVGEPVLLLGEKNEQIPQSFIDSLKRKEPAVAAAPVLPDKPPAASAHIKPGETIPLSRQQKLTAERMLQSKRQIPCFYLFVKADVTELVSLRGELNKSSTPKISYNDFIMRAVAVALEKFPLMAGRLAGDTILLPESIDIGLAVFAPAGLVVPVIRNVQKKDVAGIANDSSVLIEKARNNKLSLADLEDGCITISNLGSYGIDSFIPIVLPGQCAILGIGRITDTCVPSDHDIMVRKLMSITLSADHRIVNGAYAGQFLDFVRKLLEDTSTFSK
jgi:pyruvate dehydrogenase E2 component (dihydrolipoamide acetyltransferase)